MRSDWNFTYKMCFFRMDDLIKINSDRSEYTPRKI